MHIPHTRFELSNGLRVVLAPDRALPVVAVNLWYNVGSRNERPGRTGFAHLFEHMMFQGSEHVPDTQHIAHIERAGGAVNGSTWLDRTNYYETVPSHHLELALWLESDRMGALLPALTQEKLDNQRSVVKNERLWRVDNRPYGDWDERIQAMTYPVDHAYHHSVIGSTADLDAATLEDIREFFRTFYAPNNAVLTLCGDFDPAKAPEIIQRFFGDIPAGPPTPPIPGPATLPDQLGTEMRAVVEGDVGLPRVYLAFRIPSYGSPGFYPLDVAAHMLAAGKSSHLYARLVRERRIAQDVSAFAFPVVHGAAILVISATAAAGHRADTLEAALLAEVDAFTTSPSPTQLQRAVIGIESRQLISLQQVSERADQLSMFTTLFDDPDRINSELDQYRTVSLDQVRASGQRCLNPDNRAVLIYTPRAGVAA